MRIITDYACLSKHFLPSKNLLDAFFVGLDIVDFRCRKPCFSTTSLVFTSSDDFLLSFKTEATFVLEDDEVLP